MAENYDTIREGSLIGKKQTYLLEVSDEHNNTLFVQLSRDGQYWNVNSAGIFREAYSRRKPKVASLPTIGSNPSTETAEVNRDHSMDAVATSGNSSTTSADKVTESSEELQGKEDKFTPVPIEDGEDYVDYAARVAAVKAQHDAIKAAENATDTNPTDGQKKAGNYKKGHVQIGAFDISVEQPKGSVRRGKDADGKEWESKMNNTYGYFRGTEGVDGDHIDVFLSNDIDGWNGRKVFVVDQYNPDGTFDEHKVMLGFNDADDAKSNYLANYEKGWENGRRIDVSTTNLEDFEKWISSSHRKTKPFAEYKNVRIDEVQSPSEKYQPIIQATFNKIKREQGIIEPIAEKKRKPFTVFDITIKDPHRPMFGGVYYDGGMAVATNGVVMFAHKEAYDEAKEGKIITSKGDVIEGEFPDWRGAIPKETIPTGLQTEPLLEFVNGALARMKAEKAKKYEVDGALAYIKFQDGNVVCCQLVDLQKMLRAAKSIGADDLRLGTDKEFLVAESPAGKAIVIIQGEEKARYNAGYNNFAYEAPTVKGEEEVSDGALDNPYPSEKEVEQEAKDDNTGNVVLKQFSNVLLSADTESQRLATDAALEGLKRAGVPVEVVSDEQAAVMLGEQKGVELSAKQKRALETASPAMQDHHTVVSSADGTKVLKDLDNTIEEYEKLKGNKPNTLIGDIAKVLGATRHGSNSEYASFETKNGKLVTIRLANHNAKVSTFDNNGESEGHSIVITPKENAKLTNDGEAHITEFYYNAVKLRRAEGKPLVEILKSIKQALYSGEYKDTTGLAEVQEVNVPRAELHMVYHGSGADFDAFDHSHMGDGEGQQAYGWGTYVTEVEGIGEQYAEANHGNLDFDEEAFYDEANEYIEEVFGSRDGLDYAYNDGGFEIFNVNRDPETLNYFLDYFKEHPNEFDSWEDPNEIDVSTLDEKGIEELGRALERSMDDVVQEDVQALFEKYMTVPARHLYSVEIPDDTGSNYLDYTKNYADDRSGINTDHLIDALYDEILATDDEHLYDSKQAKKELRKELSELAFSFGKDIYGDISSYLGSDKKASEFLHRQGIVGISYPAQYRSGGREDDARNYVIFDEEDLKITDHVQFMKTPSGTLYGWTVGGKIYLTKDGLNPNTPIHEYTHLWARAMKERNKEGWQSVKELLRDTPVWDEVLKDKNYQDILDDEDAIASEALSRISGKKNAEKMEAEARKMIDEAKDYVDKAKAISLLERMKSALKKFWNWVGKDLFGIKKFSSVDEITDRVLYDLTNGTDLKGAASEKVEKQQVSTGSEEERAIIEHAKESGTYMKAPNGESTNLNEKQWAQVRTKAFKSWFGDWEKAARIEKLRKSEPVEITGNEYKGKYELNRDSAKAWIKDNLRGEYTIADTGEKIAIGRKGINKVTSHSMGNEAHLKSLIAVPKMLEQSVFITEEKADKLNAQYPTYRYYVVGLNIAGVDYTAKLTIGVDENGNKYYDHALTEIEKGKLLDQINGQAVDNGFMSTGAEPNPSVTDSKDTKLVSILQTNSSKFVDENGEPMVFYHNTNNNFSVFDSKRNGTHTDAGWLGDGFYFYGDENEGSGYGNIKMGVFLNVRDPYYATSEENNQLAEANSRDMSVDFRENLEEEGYDGVFYNGDLRQEAVVFEPNQIKSATDNNGEFSHESDDIRFRQEERAARELAEVNERFNEELQKQIDGTLPAGHVYQLGMPSRILHSAGIPNLPIELVASRLSDKSMQENHPFDLSEVVDLPNAIQRPLAVFRSATHVGSNVILTNLKHERRNYIVAIETNRRAGKVLVNSIRSVHYRNDLNIIGWINDHLADYVSEEFRENWITEKKNELLSKPQYNSVDVRKKLISAANILKDFENPTIDEKNHIALSENALSAEASHDREAMRNEAVQLSDKLHTPIKIVEDVKDITHSNAEVERRKRNSKGWYDVRTGEVVVVLPNNRDVEDVAATVMHETVAHKGLRELVGKEHYDNFLDEVYEHLRGDLKQRVDAEAGRSFVDDTTKNGEKAKSYERHRRTAVDELFGDMAEKPFEEFSEGERTLWQKLKEVVRKLLDKFLESLKLPKWFELGDNELRYMLWRSKERLERGKEHPIDMARDMVMREELGLSEAARMRMGDAPDTFKARQRRAVEEKGVVMPGLNSAEVKVVDVPRHSFTGTGKDVLKAAEEWARKNIVGTHTAINSQGKRFEYEIGNKSVGKYVSSSSVQKSHNLGIHLSVLKRLPEVIQTSIEAEIHPDYTKNNSGERTVDTLVNINSLIHRFYGAVDIDGKIYRVKTTIREFGDANLNAKAHNYEVTKIELIEAPSTYGLEANHEHLAMTSASSISVAKLLKDVEKSYDSGKKVLDESRKADENPILYRDGEETEDIWKDKSMGLHERTTAAVMRLADKHQENKTLRNDAMRAIGNNLADLRKAMSLQRKFDMATVKHMFQDSIIKKLYGAIFYMILLLGIAINLIDSFIDFLVFS